MRSSGDGSAGWVCAVRRVGAAAGGLLLAVLAGGCVRQTMTIESDPPGALVYLNQEEVGRTPMTRDFKWYGDYDVTLRLEGYQTLKTNEEVIAPWWNWVPFDLFAQLVPGAEDHRQFRYKLEPADPTRDQAGGLMERADEMRGQLEASEYTRAPTTRKSTTGPTTRPASAPAVQVPDPKQAPKPQ